MAQLKERGPGTVDAAAARQIVGKLSPASPYKEKLPESLKLLGLVDEKLRPLPALMALWGQRPSGSDKRQQPKPSAQATIAAEQTFVGKIRALKTNGYGFIETDEGVVYFFHISDLLDRGNWDRMRIGSVVQFVSHSGPKGPTAKHVQPVLAS